MESQWLFNFLLTLQFIILIGVVIWAFRMSKHLKKMKYQHVGSEQKQKKQVQVLASGSIGMGRRLVAIEKKLNLVIEKQSEILSKEGSVSYNRAMELLEMGATIDDLVSKCGLIRAEAELISLLKKKPRHNYNSNYH